MAANKTATKKRTSKRSNKKTPTNRKWSGNVTKHSNALDLEQDVLKRKIPKKSPYR
jgi:hypothetical protein